jgi:hypothetical protein
VAARDAKSRQEHDTLLDMIARRLKIPTWTIATNPGDAGDEGVPYPSPEGFSAIAYPDILAREKFTGRLSAVGEVETASSVTEEEARDQWRLFAQLAPKFFLYVPKECEAEARRLLRKYGIRPEGLFLFSFTERNFFIVERARGR